MGSSTTVSAALILQKLLAFDFYGALQGGENVFYYGGPGLRYFRALEHIVFGESYLGYLSLVLSAAIPRLLSVPPLPAGDWSLGLTVVFVAVPIGTVFGTSFIDYAKWVAQGFADPVAYILFVAALFRSSAPVGDRTERNSARHFSARLLLALGICMKPIVAPAAAVLLGGAGLVSLYSWQFRRLAGLCLGFLPVFSMALHNWIYGHVFVLFSANAAASSSAGDAAVGLRGGCARTC